MNPLHEKIVQIAVATDPENGEVLYALDSQGNVWERVFDIPPRKLNRYPAGSGLRGNNIDTANGLTESLQFMAGATPGWRRVSLEESRPVYHEEDPRRGLSQE